MSLLRAKSQHHPGTLQNLAEIRRTRGMSQREVAEAAGVATLTVLRAENGRGLTLGTVAKIAAALEVEPRDLM